MQDDDDAQGFSPTSPWRRSKKRKDYSDEEDYAPFDDDAEEEEDKEEDEEEEEEDPKHVTNTEYKGKLKPSPIPIASVRVVPPSVPRKQTARMRTGGKTPRLCLASKNPVANLNRREYMHVPKKDLQGEWDSKLPKKKKGSSPEWKPCNLGQRLWGDLDQATQDFQRAYGILMGIIRDLQIHYDLIKPKKEEDK